MSRNQVVPYEESKLFRVRHSAAHVMAQAVLELYPEAKLAIGPPTSDGFYYDFDLGVDKDDTPKTFSPKDLEKIEEKMREIIHENHTFVYREVDIEEAKELFKEQPYKLELLGDLEQKSTALVGDDESNGVVISTYRHDNFEDLCRGPHVRHTGEIPIDGLKLMSVAGAYWRGDENQPMLQRLYGTVWPSRKELRKHLHMLQEAKKRDHRKLGLEQELFMFDDEVGPGLALWLPRGEVLVQELEKLAREVEDKAGYQRVRTPHIAKESMYLKSGHLPYYADDMFPPMERGLTRYYLKPMNCPFHHKIFASKSRSYRDLPLRLAEHGMVYRYEQSGELFGLMRVRGNQQNDAHIYCTEAQFKTEFLAVIQLYHRYFELFGIEKYQMQLSKHSKAGLGIKYVENERLWLKTEDMVRQSMITADIPFTEADDEAAFYGPKIDVQVWSAIGREFSLATNQVDFAVPARFNLVFTNENGEDEIPLCIHRAPLGSHERMIGFLIEHYNGSFPLWLSPEQVRVIPITDAHIDYANEILSVLRENVVRAQADLSSDRVGRKIRQAQLLKIPYMLIVGDAEFANQTVSLRIRDGRQKSEIQLASFLEAVRQRIKSRSTDL